jgi:hypothetical protein
VADRPNAIVPVAQDDDNNFINMVLYGDNGVGKTPMIGTGERTLILEADPRGTSSAKAAGSRADKMPVREHRDLLEAYEYLRHGGTDDYHWVWLDSMALFQEGGLRGIMEDLHARKSHREVWLPDKGEYGQNMNRIKLWVANMVDLPIHFGFTTTVHRQEDEDTGKVTYQPWIQGRNMIPTVCGYMNMIAWMYTKVKEGGDQETVIRTRKAGKYYARDRFNAIPNGRMVSPSIPRIERLVSKKLEEGVTSSSAPKARKSTPTRKKVVK